LKETCIGLNHDNGPIRQGFDWLIKHIEYNYENLKSRIEEDVKKQKSREEKEKKEKADKVKQQRKPIMR
jgi:hypothetical protein